MKGRELRKTVKNRREANHASNNNQVNRREQDGENKGQT